MNSNGRLACFLRLYALLLKVRSVPIVAHTRLHHIMLLIVLCLVLRLIAHILTVSLCSFASFHPVGNDLPLHRHAVGVLVLVLLQRQSDAFVVHAFFLVQPDVVRLSLVVMVLSFLEHHPVRGLHILFDLELALVLFIFHGQTVSAWLSGLLLHISTSICLLPPTFLSHHAVAGTSDFLDLLPEAWVCQHVVIIDGGIFLLSSRFLRWLLLVLLVFFCPFLFQVLDSWLLTYKGD